MLPGLYSSECKDAKTDMHMFTSLTLRLLPLRDEYNVHNQVYGVDYFRGKPHPHFPARFYLDRSSYLKTANSKSTPQRFTLSCYLKARFAIPAQVATKRSIQIGFILTTRNIWNPTVLPSD